MMADDTVGLLGALGIAQANIMGISLGGRIALALAGASRIREESDPGLDQPRGPEHAGTSPGLPPPRGPQANSRPGDPQAGLCGPAHQRRASQGYDATERLHEIHVPDPDPTGRRTGSPHTGWRRRCTPRYQDRRNPPVQRRPHVLVLEAGGVHRRGGGLPGSGQLSAVVVCEMRVDLAPASLPASIHGVPLCLVQETSPLPRRLGTAFRLPISEAVSCWDRGSRPWSSSLSPRGGIPLLAA